MYIGMPFLQKLMFPSRLNKYNLDDLFTDKPPTQTNTTDISGTCVVRKKKTIRHEQN